MHLILDLDGTLIEEGPDTVVLRPYVKEFLDYCFSEFTVHVWTAASKLWADEVLAALPRSDFHSVRCGANTSYMYSWYGIKVRQTKDLGRYYDKDWSIIVDDTPESFRRNYGNAVYIKTYKGNTDDRELLDLIPKLTTLKAQALAVGSVRKVQRPRWYE